MRPKYASYEACGNFWEFTRVPFGVTNGVNASQRQMNQLAAKIVSVATFLNHDNITVKRYSNKKLDEIVNRLLKALERNSFPLNDGTTVPVV